MLSRKNKNITMDISFIRTNYNVQISEQLNNTDEISDLRNSAPCPCCIISRSIFLPQKENKGNGALNEDTNNKVIQEDDNLLLDPLGALQQLLKDVANNNKYKTDTIKIVDTHGHPHPQKERVIEYMKIDQIYKNNMDDKLSLISLSAPYHNQIGKVVYHMHHLLHS